MFQFRIKVKLLRAREFFENLSFFSDFRFFVTCFAAKRNFFGCRASIDFSSTSEVNGASSKVSRLLDVLIDGFLIGDCRDENLIQLSFKESAKRVTRRKLEVETMMRYEDIKANGLR